MTFGKPVITRGALNFTPDNQYAYAFGGTINGTDDTLMEIENTGDIALLCDLYLAFDYDAIGSNQDVGASIKINDVEVFFMSQEIYPSGTQTSSDPYKYKFVLPAYSKLSITGTSTVNANKSASIVGKAVGREMVE